LSGGNPKGTIAKIKLDIDTYGKKTPINRLASSEKVKLLVKSAIKTEWLIQNEHFPYIQIIFRNSKRTIANVKK